MRHAPCGDVPAHPPGHLLRRGRGALGPHLGPEAQTREDRDPAAGRARGRRGQKGNLSPRCAPRCRLGSQDPNPPRKPGPGGRSGRAASARAGDGDTAAQDRGPPRPLRTPEGARDAELERGERRAPGTAARAAPRRALCYGLGKRRKMAQVLGSLHPRGRPRKSSWLLASDQRSSGHCGCGEMRRPCQDGRWQASSLTEEWLRHPPGNRL
ncbi:collagen alpha-1(XI) chain-like [Lepus europaeus]|uniref:collagen alpha-1(XI) chain-like n=1 Tax=Lepus europaeus TaxID=9983 RepID=UPI002B4719C6|nr:collagen alpha-1(XI) chain-like [Lepus europaeus]